MKGKKTIFFLILILTSNISLAFSATDEGYGEDSQALGQFVDTYTSLDNVSVIDNVVRNASLNAMELNYTGAGGKAYENFTEYTEVDVGADRIQKSDYHVDHKSYRNEITYLYYDKGVDYFTDFEHEVNGRSGLEQTLANGEIWTLANYLGDIIWLGTNNKHFLSLGFYRGTSYAQIVLREGHNGNNYVDTMNYPSVNTWYYFIINKTSTAFSVEIYSDSARTNLLDTLSLILHVDNAFRYIYGCDSVNTGQTNYLTTDTEYLWIGDMSGGYDTDGYFTSTDYLSSPIVNGSAIVHMSNTTIPTDTGITIEFSDDNSTWILNDWEPLFGGFESIDLRDLNYSTGYYTRHNMTSTGTDTPRVYQSRVITTIGNSTGGGGPVVSGGINSATILMLIFLCSIGIIIIVKGVKK